MEALSVDTVVGLDPDSDRHGVAVYRDGKLQELLMLTLPDLRRWISAQPGRLYFSIEDVMSQSFVYGRNVQVSKAAQSKVAVGIGRCQQAQEEVVRELQDRGILFELHKPTSANWAGRKGQFELVTGWQGRSNTETRSAAYFGYIATLALRRRTTGARP